MWKLLCALLAERAAAHGMMLVPLSRAAQSMLPHVHNGLSLAGDCSNTSCIWYSQQAFIPGNATNCDPKMRTLGVHCGSQNPWDFKCIGKMRAPWCAPGTAPVKSPCGVFNGGFGQAGRDMLDLPGPVQATWVAGSTAPVAFAITANHGGGYSYRLCPAGSDLTEECFQQHPLAFASTSSWVLDRDGLAVKEFQAARTTNGTTPPGSQWTRNPIPMEAQADVYGTPPVEGMFGPGPSEYSVGDLVRVPDLPEGKYVVSYRWDSESVMQECDAWAEFYDAMNGPNWIHCSEYRLDPCSCPQTRWGSTVFCNSYQNYQHIHEVYLLENNLTGRIPKSIGAFQRLLALDLSENDIFGTVPDELGSISTLSALWLHHNPRLGGPLPDTLRNLKFYALELQWCNFTGTLPALEYHDIANCLLYGSVFDCPVPEQSKSCGAACRDPPFFVV